MKEKKSNKNTHKQDNIVGASKAVQKILKFVDRIAPLKNTNVLIEGGKGVGKEMLAKKIIHQSNINGLKCAFIDCSLFDGEQLLKKLSDCFSTSVEGIIFIKNIEKMNFLSQKGLHKLLVKNKALVKKRVRILASCCENFQDYVDKKLFKKQLYNALNPITITIPSLKERDKDIELLAKHFLNKSKNPMAKKSFDSKVLEVLKQYSWPGNVEELKNAIERAYALSEEKIIKVSHLDNCILQSTKQKKQNPKEYLLIGLAEVEKNHIMRVLKYLQGNKSRTAKVLGITVKTLYNKLHNYNMI